MISAGEGDFLILLPDTAHKDAEEIAGRVSNLLSQDYPAHKLQVYIGSDGSDDNTVAEARSVADERVTVFDFKERRGKTTVLNELIARAASPVIILSDANTTMPTIESARYRASWPFRMSRAARTWTAPIGQGSSC